MKQLLHRLACPAVLFCLSLGGMSPLPADLQPNLPTETPNSSAPTQAPLSGPAAGTPVPEFPTPGFPGPGAPMPDDHGPGCAGGCCYQTMAFDLIEGPQNWAFMYPDGGFTTYPGL